MNQLHFGSRTTGRLTPALGGYPLLLQLHEAVKQQQVSDSSVGDDAEVMIGVAGFRSSSGSEI